MHIYAEYVLKAQKNSLILIYKNSNRPETNKP